jgi:hypothetical protein
MYIFVYLKLKWEKILIFIISLILQILSNNQVKW